MKMGRVDIASKRYAFIENISFIALYRTEKIQTLCQHQNQNKQSHTRAIRSCSTHEAGVYFHQYMSGIYNNL